MKTKLMLTLSALALVATATYVAAGNNESRDQSGQQWLPKQEIEARLNQMGYEVRKLEAENGCVEAKVIDRDGVRSELYVDPMTGNPGCGGKIRDRDDS